VPDGGLAERARVGEERRDSRFTACGVEPVDEVRERVERDMLGEGHGERQTSILQIGTAPCGGVDQAERHAVEHVDREPGCPPAAAPRYRLPENGDVRIVAAEEPLVDGLEHTPDRCRDGSGHGRMEATLRHNRSVPEGDALHRAARRLQPLVGETLEVETPHPRAAATGVAERLDGRRLEKVEAVGKNLLLRFEGGLVLRSHLRMNGRWTVRERGAEARGRPWLILRGGAREAVLWGGSVLELNARAVSRLGPDILARPPDFDRMVGGLRRSDQRRAVGDALLDQRLVAGIGNLWKAESLWRAQVSPWLPLADVSDEELRRVLGEAALLMRGSLEGRREARAVYRAAGRPCPRCSTPIESRGQGDDNRTAYWCPTCQPGPDPKKGLPSPGA
jgi:endonuclease VIII